MNFKTFLKHNKIKQFNDFKAVINKYNSSLNILEDSSFYY